MAMLQLRRAVCLRRQRDFEGAKEVWQMVVWCLFLGNGEWDALGVTRLGLIVSIHASSE